MKRRCFAQVEMKITRQVEFDFDDEFDAAEDIAAQIAKSQYGEYDNIDVIECDVRG